MYYLYTVERYAADARAQQLNDAHTARLLRQAHAQPSLVARMYAWWRTQFAPITAHAAEHPAAH